MSNSVRRLRMVQLRALGRSPHRWTKSNKYTPSPGRAEYPGCQPGLDAQNYASRSKLRAETRDANELARLESGNAT